MRESRSQHILLGAKPDEAQELIESSWGTSENNRRARFYKLTAAGRRRLHSDTQTWDRYAAAVARVLRASTGPEPAKQ